jgi:hypothetical protein
MHSNTLKETKYLQEQDIFKLRKENYANTTSSTSHFRNRNNKLLDKNEKVSINSNTIVHNDGDDDDDDQDDAEIEE